MKIAILTPTFHQFSGIDRVAQSQAEEFAKKGHQVMIITLSSTIKPKGYKIIELGTFKSPFLQRLHRLFFFLDIRKMSSYHLLKGYNKAIAHFYPMTMIACNAKKKYGVRYIYWDHGINTTGLLDSIMQKTYMALFRFFNNQSISICDEAYSVSKYLSDQLWKESKIKSKVRYNQIDKKRFNPRVNGEKITKKFSLQGKKVFLYVGRIAPHKGIHLLIKAFKLAKEKEQDLKLLIIGKPTFEGYMRKLRAMADKDVIFAGVIEDRDLPSCYASCDAYVTCSQWEGFDLPAAEAQACGKKVIAFDVGSHREIIKKGELIPLGDLNAFSIAMRVMASKKKHS